MPQDPSRVPTPVAQGYWFKRKTYGWGWTPATWQGWLVTGIYVAVLVALGATIDEASSRREVALMFVLPFVLATVALIRICYQKGEPPRWQWGADETDEK